MGGTKAKSKSKKGKKASSSGSGWKAMKMSSRQACVDFLKSKVANVVEFEDNPTFDGFMRYTALVGEALGRETAAYVCFADTSKGLVQNIHAMLGMTTTMHLNRDAHETGQCYQMKNSTADYCIIIRDNVVTGTRENFENNVLQLVRQGEQNCASDDANASGGFECMVCFETVPSLASSFTCSHNVYCAECCFKMAECPQCRAPKSR